MCRSFSMQIYKYKHKISQLHNLMATTQYPPHWASEYLCTVFSAQCLLLGWRFSTGRYGLMEPKVQGIDLSIDFLILILECEHRREQALQGGLISGAFVPLCSPDGTFELLQCHSATGQCFCVDEHGVEIPGTRTLPGEVPADCKSKRKILQKFLRIVRVRYRVAPCRLFIF